MATVVKNNNKTIPTYASSKAKIVNNPIGAILGGVIVYHIATRHAGIENIWAKVAVTAVGVVAGAYLTSALKRNY